MAEKSASDISRAIRDQFDKGMAAVHRQNWDYAIAIFNQVLSQEPAFYDCRAALRVAQFKKAGDGPGFFKKFLGPAGRSPGLAKAQMALRSNPLEAIETLEQILNNDPQNGAAHRLLAEGAQAADLPRTAVLSLEIAFKHNPKDRGLALRLAEALGNIGELNKAEKIYQDLLRANPNDSETAQAYKNLSAKRTLTEGGYDALSDGQGSYRDILRDKEGAITREQEQRQVKPDDVLNRVLADYETRLQAEPGNFALWRAAAELYAQKKDFTRALEYYQRIASSEAGRDASLERAISETTLNKFDHALAQYDPQNPAHTAEIQALREERALFRLRDAQRLVERYPNDLQLRFELGQLYFDTGKISEAIQEFQKSQVSPALRVSSLFYLGQCFARRNMNDLAARSFQNALKEKVVFDDEKKEILYALGTVLENQGHRDQAIEAFKQIYEVDIGFKDVAAKVDRYYTQK